MHQMILVTATLGRLFNLARIRKRCRVDNRLTPVDRRFIRYLYMNMQTLAGIEPDKIAGFGGPNRTARIINTACAVGEFDR